MESLIQSIFTNDIQVKRVAKGTACLIMMRTHTATVAMSGCTAQVHEKPRRIENHYRIRTQETGALVAMLRTSLYLALDSPIFWSEDILQKSWLSKTS